MDSVLVVKTLLLILAIVVNLLLALLVITNNRRSATNRVYLFLSIVIALWLTANYISLLPSLPVGMALTWIRLSISLAVLMSFMFYLFAQVLPHKHLHIRKATLLISSITAAVGVVVTLTPLVFKSAVSVNGSVSPTPGPGIGLFAAISTIFSVLAIIVLIRKMRAAQGLEKTQFRYVVLGIATMLGLIILTVLIPVVILKLNVFVSFLPLYTIVFLGVTTYAIIKQRLFDVRLIVARSVAYILMITTLAAIYSALILGSHAAIFTGLQGSVLQNIFGAAAVVILVFVFQPLRQFFDFLTNRIFFHDIYDSQEVMSNLTRILVSELDLNRILKRSLTLVCEELHIEFGQIVVFNGDQVYRIEHVGPLPKRLMIAPELRLLDRPILVSDELESGERKHVLERHGIRVSLLLKTREDFVGYILLGNKMSGDIYSNQDIELLEIVGKELAVAILNAKAYDEIQAFNLTLQARVDHATNRLRVANRHLKDLDRAKDEFISMASHQLRTPLTTVKGYLSMMLEGDVGKLHSDQKEFVQYAFDASERMVNLISDLLNVSRLSAGRFLIQTKPTDMVAMISDEVRQLQNHAKQKGIALVFEPPKEPLPPAEIDDNKTRQVVMNFIDNAIYYTQHGEVRVVLEQTGDHVRLEVRDSGIGVPEDAKKKLFSKFFRAGNAQTVRPDGTGLGLYLAKRVVEDQNGTIIFNSVEGKGSTFGFELPFKPPKPVKKKHEEKSGHPATHK